MSIYIIALVIIAILAFVYYKFIRIEEPEFKLSDNLNNRLVVIDNKKQQKNLKVEEEDSHLPVLTIIFYTQSGMSEDFAFRIAEDVPSKYVKTKCYNASDYEPEKFPEEKNVIFVVSTYGEGEPPDPAQDFHTWLMDEEREMEDYTNMNFAVFGLGSSCYEHYNNMGKVISKRLQKLGANQFYAYGEGDDDKNIEEDFLKWKKDLPSALTEIFPDIIFDNDSVVTFKRKERVEIIKEDDYKGVDVHNIPRWRNEGVDISLSTSNSNIEQKNNPIMARVLVNRELHDSKSDRSCRHIEISSEDVLKYECGDHIGIFPQNDTTLVHNLGASLGVNIDTVVTIYSQTNNSVIIGPCTVKALFSQFYDITSIIRKPMLKVLAFYATDLGEKKSLEKLANEDIDNQEYYREEIVEKQRTVLEVLHLFPSSRPPLDHFLESLPRLQPRYYSISSSPLVHPNSIHVTAVVVEWITPSKRHAKGVATNYLKDFCIPTDEFIPKIPVFVRKNMNFKLPKLEVPIIMVGPGTGLAPFRGFVQERDELLYKKKEIVKERKDLLFFGCRQPDIDYLYKEELEEYNNHGVIELYTAFSRAQEHKVYVQHRMLEDEVSIKIWQYLHDLGAQFYLCGDANRLVADVHEALCKVAEKHGNFSSHDEAKHYVDVIIKERYFADVWS